MPTWFQPGPIWRSAMRKPGSFALLCVQIAIGLAVISNAISVYFFNQQILARQSGLDEANTFYFTSSGFAPDLDTRGTIYSDLTRLRASPLVTNAVQSNALPYSDSGKFYELSATPQNSKVKTSAYFVDEHGVEAFAVTLLAGANFKPNEIVWSTQNGLIEAQSVMISAWLADKLFPNSPLQDVVGKPVFIDGTQAVRITAVFDLLHVPFPEAQQLEASILIPGQLDSHAVRYAVRVKPGHIDEVIKEVLPTLKLDSSGRTIRRIETVSQLKQTVFASQRAVMDILALVIAILVFVLAMGYMGLASYRVQQRQSQLGTRRALGASRQDIILLVIQESLLPCIIGLLFGIGLSFALNQYLHITYSVTLVSTSTLLLSASSLLVMCVLATLPAAFRASQLEPATAIRRN